MPNDWQSAIEEFLAELERGGPYESMDDMGRAVTRIARRHNAQPDAAFGGLTAYQAFQLLTDDWTSPDAIIHLNDSLTLDDLAGAPFLADARTVLDYIATEGPVAETPRRSLKPTTLAALWPRLTLPGFFPGFDDPNRPPASDEDEAYWLLPLRYALKLARLTMRRKGVRITARGRDLMRAERAGTLYALLFRTVFQQVNLQAFDRERHAGLQETLGYTLFQLRECASHWTSAAVLAETAWLESGKDPLDPWAIESDEDYRYRALANQVLRPLAAFGLLETRPLVDPDPPLFDDTLEYRVSALYNRFFRFEIEALDTPAFRIVR